MDPDLYAAQVYIKRCFDLIKIRYLLTGMWFIP